MFLHKIERNLVKIWLHDSDIILRKKWEKTLFELSVTLLKTTKKAQQKLRRYANGIDN